MSTPQTAVEVLIAARELISVPERWTQGKYWRDKNGEYLPGDSTPICWCAWGAVRHCGDYPNIQLALSFLIRAANVGGIADWNDAACRTHAEVLAAFDKAIELARAEEGQCAA